MTRLQISKNAGKCGHPMEFSAVCCPFLKKQSSSRSNWRISFATISLLVEFWRSYKSRQRNMMSPSASYRLFIKVIPPPFHSVTYSLLWMETRAHANIYSSQISNRRDIKMVAFLSMIKNGAIQMLWNTINSNSEIKSRCRFTIRSMLLPSIAMNLVATKYLWQKTSSCRRTK